MTNKLKRTIEHLTNSINSEDVINAIQAVEDLFSSVWLSKQGGHRLQKLWIRRDALSTSELYSLGKSIIKLSVDNRKWLEANAKQIKNNNDNSHGFLTEMIIIGSLSTENGIIKPCPKSFKLYDYTVDFDTVFNYKVSIKNYDITQHEKDFNIRCEIIRKIFKNFLQAYKLSGKLVIMLKHDFLNDDLQKQICFFIAFKMKKYGVYYFDNEKISIFFHEINENEYDRNKLVNHSDAIIVIAKHHKNEQRNIISKINDVNDKLLSDPDESKSLKKLIIRLGATANIDFINEHLNNITENWQKCGFDMYLLLQPQVVFDTENNNEMICTSIKSGCKSFYPLSSKIQSKFEKLKMVKMEFSIGTISSQSAPMVLMINNKPIEISLNSYYVFQKGDLCNSAERLLII